MRVRAGSAQSRRLIAHGRVWHSARSAVISAPAFSRNDAKLVHAPGPPAFGARPGGRRRAGRREPAPFRRSEHWAGCSPRPASPRTGVSQPSCGPGGADGPGSSRLSGAVRAWLSWLWRGCRLAGFDLFFLMIRGPSRSTLFPYPTLITLWPFPDELFERDARYVVCELNY